MHHAALLVIALLLMSCALLVPVARSPGALLEALPDSSTGLTPINVVQGSGARSPLEGAYVEVRGVVTGRSETGLYLQSVEEDDDHDPATSEGLFVYLGTAPADSIRLGTRLRAHGVVAEHDCACTHGPSGHSATQTRLQRARLQVIRRGVALPAPILLDADALAQERLEGMRVRIATLTLCAHHPLAAGDRHLYGHILPERSANTARDGPPPPQTHRHASHALRRQDPDRHHAATRVGIPLDRSLLPPVAGQRCVARDITGPLVSLAPSARVLPTLLPSLDCLPSAVHAVATLHRHDVHR